MAELTSRDSRFRNILNSVQHSSTSLNNTILSFQPHNTRARDLVNELQELNGVLDPLGDAINHATSVHLAMLDLPLQQCGKACESFKQELLKCSASLGADRTSFHNWGRLRYMGDDIGKFQQLIAMYRWTITITCAYTDP